MRHPLLVVLCSSVLLGACGGEPKPAASPSGGGTAESKVEPTRPEPKADKPKVASKYPDPFLEPSCAEPQPEGYLPDAKKAISEVRKKHWSELEACARAAAEGANVAGEIRTSFRLDPDGVPRCVEVQLPPAGMEETVRCVIAAYRTFRFPKPKNGSVRVTDGIHLQVSDEDED